ncbi:MAG: amidohydrolase, partial [Synergistaceae bacterium]|jgi:predicted amidohydrolase YtcJ|nr:amidohydrolase [Synergistaceae bacterium]
MSDTGLKIYRNGDILTVDEDFRAAESVVTDGDRIVFAGPSADAALWAGHGAESVDLGGACMLPGFIDAHGHFGKVAQQNAWAELVPQDYFRPQTRSIDQIVETLRAHAERLADENEANENEPVVGFGYHETNIAEKRHPNRFDLDRVSAERPVVIASTSLHIFVFNTPALALLSVSADTPDTDMTKIWRAPGTNEPSGVIQGPLAQEYFFNIKIRDEKKRLEAFEKAQAYYFRHGVTTVCEGKSTADDIALLDLAAGSGKLRIDVVSFVDYTAIDEVLARFPYEVGETRNRIRIAGIKIISDGTLSSGAYLSRPFEGTDDRGIQYISAKDLSGNIERALRNRWSFCVHAIGDAAVDKVMDAYEEALSRTGPVPNEPVKIINHATSVRLDQLPRVKSLGFTLSLFPSATSKLYELFCSTIGKERADATNPVRSALSYGIPVTAHNDAPVFEADPLIVVWAAMNRKSVTSGAVFCPEERVGAEDAIRLTTISAARQYGIERDRGSIEPGKRADFVILDANPLRTPPEKIGEIRVLATVKSGETVYNIQNRGSA